MLLEVEESVPLEIREERPGDVAGIREVNRLAFGQDQEANIVDALRSNGGVTLSLVAVTDDRVIGHILYTPLSVAGKTIGAGLGPMAVHPDHQRQGVGSRLVQAGNEKLKATGCAFIIVVGHSHYYPRFGFGPASARGITCEWDVPDDVFMVLVLDEARMRGVSGMAKYRHEFLTV
jgi:putative acetyltransferase